MASNKRFLEFLLSSIFPEIKIGKIMGRPQKIIFEAGAMSNIDLNDWEFADDEEANMTIRAAVHYRLMGVAASDRGDIVSEIIEIVRRAAHDQPDQPDPFDDEEPGG